MKIAKLTNIKYPDYVPMNYDPEKTYEIMNRNKGKEGNMPELKDLDVFKTA